MSANHTRAQTRASTRHRSTFIPSPLSTLAAGAAALLLTVALPSERAEAAPSAKSIVAKANLVSYYAGKDGRAKIKMTIVDKNGRKRRRSFYVVRRNKVKGGDQDYLVLFTRPAAVRKTTFLVAKHAGRDDDRWMYLPALDLVKRIAAGDKRTSFVGSHVFYEDISGRHHSEDSHKLLRTTAEHHVILSTPKRKGSVEFASYTLWIDKKTMLPMKIEYKNRSGKVYRRIVALKVKTIGGHPTATKMKFYDLAGGGHTTTRIYRIQYDVNVPSSVFTERSLRNPPRKWLKPRRK